jgi:predicted nucleic acid-binding protein
MLDTIIITDTSCLIALTNIKILHLLPELYKHIVITKEICAEFIEPLPQWIEIREVANKKYQQLLENTLGKGEASSIALAIELENVLLVIDELKGRKEAERLGIKITGTLGILFRMKQKGLLSTIKPYLELLQTCGFRVAPVIIEKLLQESDEIKNDIAAT